MLVLLRSTTACNLRCRYCSASCGEAGRRDLTEEDCRLLLRQLPSVLATGEEVSYCWHGGEPTLLAPESFAAMQDILSGIAREGHPVRCSMQTNGYAVNDAWLDALQRFDVGVGLSLDGPPALHDAMRVTPGGGGSYAQAAAHAQAMRCRGISVSLLCTVQEQHLGREAAMMDWLEEQGCSIRFNPLLHLGRAKSALDLERYYAFLRNMLRHSLERRFTHSIEPLEWMLAAVIADKPPTECSYSGGCGSFMFAYGPGGEVGACNRSGQAFGNLYETPLATLRTLPAWQERLQRQERLRAHCAACSIWPFCHGGCPEGEGEIPDAGRCAARRSFFTWLRSEGLEIYRQALLQQRDRVREHLRLLRETKAALAPALNAIPSVTPAGNGQ